MRKFLVATAIAAIAIPAFAQQPTSPMNQNSNTPAINTPNSPTNKAAPVTGANSFTEGQAKSRIEAKGYSGVSGLKKDDKGIWRGMAKQGDKNVAVSVDFQGNVVTN
jgi:hypothetical protein